ALSVARTLLVSVVQVASAQRRHLPFEATMYRTAIRILLPAAAVITAAGCASAPSPLNRVAVAYATISNAAGERRGTAELWQDLDKVVHVDVQLTGLPPGPHGIHFHEKGLCEPEGATAFASAGSHFNPLGRQHGLD